MAYHTVGELKVQHLTGNTRTRLGWFGKMILQVEVKSPLPRYPAAPTPPGQPYDVWDQGSYTYWRDARFEDLVPPVRNGVYIPKTAPAGGSSGTPPPKPRSWGTPAPPSSDD